MPRSNRQFRGHNPDLLLLLLILVCLIAESVLGKAILNYFVAKTNV